MIRYLAFRWREVFPEDDPLAEWLVTLAIAMNDLTLVHVRLEADQGEPEKHFYWNRLAFSHFTEAALFLDDTVAVEEVRTFIDSLNDEARAKCDECLAIFNECRGRLFDVRNKTTFQYPALRPGVPDAERPVRDSLVELRDERGIIRSARLRDARALFADDVVATAFLRVLGGRDALDAFAARVADGVAAFIRFANLALDEHLMRRSEAGAAVEEVEPVDPENPDGDGSRRPRLAACLGNTSRSSVPSGDVQYVWRLSWNSDERPLLVVGLMPSTADEEHADATVAKLIAIANNPHPEVGATTGFGELVMMNMFARRPMPNHRAARRIRSRRPNPR